MPTETMVQACARLNAKGYTGQVRAEEEGLRFLGAASVVFRPEDLVVDEVIRLEGTSAPEEQVVIFALRSQQGDRRATYCVSHGSDQDMLDAEMMQRLPVQPEADKAVAAPPGPLRQQY